MLHLCLTSYVAVHVHAWTVLLKGSFHMDCTAMPTQ
jgi:hypothetical protein